jgi:hypothetical protein
MLISGNKARMGGGIYFRRNKEKDGVFYHSQLTNATISGNIATDGLGDGIYNYAWEDGVDMPYWESFLCAPHFRNCIIWGNGTAALSNVHNTILSVPVYSHSLVEGVITSFILDGKNPLFDADFHLQKGSPAINAGNNQFFSAGQTPDLSAITTDLSGNLRIYNGKVDLGAYEFQQNNDYTLTFAGEEINITPQSIEYGKLATRPVNPQRTGFDFGGWYTDNNTFLNEWNFENNIVTSDTTLWGKWIQEETRVTKIENASIKLYPTPVKDELRIESGDLNINRIEIIDLSGKMICQFNHVSHQINVSGLGQGVYIVKIETDKGYITGKITKE